MTKQPHRKHRVGERVQFACMDPMHGGELFWATFCGDWYSVAEGEGCARCRAAKTPLRLVESEGERS